MKVDRILKSKVLFYGAVVLMIVNVVGYVSVGSMECVIVFAVATYVANHFTKNRALDIFIGLFIANVLFGCGRVKEGFQSDADKLKEVMANQATKLKEALKANVRTRTTSWKDGKCVKDSVKKKTHEKRCKKRREWRRIPAAKKADAAK